MTLLIAWGLVYALAVARASVEVFAMNDDTIRVGDYVTTPDDRLLRVERIVMRDEEIAECVEAYTGVFVFNTSPEVGDWLVADLRKR